MKTTPYQRLLAATRSFVSRARHPRRTVMWSYPKAKLNEHWTLGDLYERCRAADQLGHDVRLVALDDGLYVQYVQRPGDIDYFIG